MYMYISFPTKMCNKSAPYLNQKSANKYTALFCIGADVSH